MMGTFMQMPNIYQGNYKLLIILPLLLVAASLYFIPSIKMGVDFRGGSQLEVITPQQVDSAALQTALQAGGFQVNEIKSLPIASGGYKLDVQLGLDGNLTRMDSLKSSFYSKVDEVSRLESDIVVTNESAEAVARYSEARKDLDSTANSIFAIAGMGQNASAQQTNELRSSVFAAYNKTRSEYSQKLNDIVFANVETDQAPRLQDVSASVSADFVQKAGMTVLYSTVLVSIVVFLIFRTFIPSIAVLVGAACDVIIALGAMGLLGIPFTLASFAALLMLVGFSLDTDVLLTMRVVKRKEKDPRTRAYEAFQTGTTMSMALLLSFVCLFVLASLTHINVYYEISTVAIAGLFGDIIATWCLNAVIVLAYAEKHGHRGEEKPFLSSIFSG
jgi:preprotein translocase subunit SecF